MDTDTDLIYSEVDFVKYRLEDYEKEIITSGIEDLLVHLLRYKYHGYYDEIDIIPETVLDDVLKETNATMFKATKKRTNKKQNFQIVEDKSFIFGGDLTKTDLTKAKTMIEELLTNME